MITIHIDNGPQIGHRVFSFPDGQMHVELARGINFSRVTLRAAIMNPNDLFELMLIKDVIDSQRHNEITLDLRYLMGGRMDKKTSYNEPLTLRVVCDMLEAMDWARIRVLDPHSTETKHYLGGPRVNVYYADKELEHALDRRSDRDTILVSPDAGADKKLDARLDSAGISKTKFPRITAHKTREQSTGEITNMFFNPEIVDAIYKKDCVIIDDICDGGATFVECAKLLRAARSGSVYLFVTHGLFTKGLPLEGIDHVYTTNSTSKLFLKNIDKRLLTVLGG